MLTIYAVFLCTYIGSRPPGCHPASPLEAFRSEGQCVATMAALPKPLSANDYYTCVANE